MALLARVRTVFLGVAGTPYYNNLYFAPGGGVIQPAAAHALVTTFWTSAMADLDNNMTATVEGEVPILEDTTGAIQTVETVGQSNINVTGQADPLPFTTQGLARLTTTSFVAGRRVRGRIFIPGQCEINNAIGVPGATYITSIDADLNLLAGDGDAPLAIWARPFPGDPDHVPPKPARLGSTHVVSDTSLWTQWATMRSRRD